MLNKLSDGDESCGHASDDNLFTVTALLSCNALRLWLYPMRKDSDVETSILEGNWNRTMMCRYNQHSDELLISSQRQCHRIAAGESPKKSQTEKRNNKSSLRIPIRSVST